jgi:serine protease Do
VKWLRDGKEQKATAELGKWKGQLFYESGASPMQGFNMENFNTDMNNLMPRIQEFQNRGGMSFSPGFSWNGNGPKLGLSVQDTDDGKGVKVIDVDSESNAAKAGIKEEDIITEFDGKAVNSTDEVVKIIKESKDKISVMVKLQRNGKTQNIEVKMPRKLKTAEL